MKNYIILSLRHSTGEEACFWKADNAGYTIYPFGAGVYTEEQVKAKPTYYNDGHNTLAIPLTTQGMESIGLKCTFDTKKVKTLLKNK